MNKDCCMKIKIFYINDGVHAYVVIFGKGRIWNPRLYTCMPRTHKRPRRRQRLPRSLMKGGIPINSCLACSEEEKEKTLISSLLSKGLFPYRAFTKKE